MEHQQFEDVSHFLKSDDCVIVHLAMLVVPAGYLLPGIIPKVN